MPSNPATYLKDSSGQVWQLGVTNSGAYTTTPVLSFGPTSILLQDTVTNQIWSMNVNTDGSLTITASSGAPAPLILAFSPDGTAWNIVVSNAAISTVHAGNIPPPPPTINAIGCNPFLKDPLGNYWRLGVIDDGRLTTTKTTVKLLFQNGPILTDTSGHRTNWQLNVDIQGRITATRLNYLPTIQRDLSYIPLLSPGGFAFNLTITPFGMLQTTSTSTLFPDVIPYIPDVSMSIYGASFAPPGPILCPSCANASVIVSADLSCWCCACSSFVLPEDTTIMVVLEE